MPYSFRYSSSIDFLISMVDVVCLRNTEAFFFLLPGRHWHIIQKTHNTYCITFRWWNWLDVCANNSCSFLVIFFIHIAILYGISSKDTHTYITSTIISSCFILLQLISKRKKRSEEKTTESFLSVEWIIFYENIIFKTWQSTNRDRLSEV